MSLRCRKSTSSPPPRCEGALNYRGGAGVPVREDNYALLLVQALNEMGASYEWTLTETHIGWDLYDECVAILSRLPIRGIKPIEMSPDYGYHQVQRRAAQAALIETETGTFWCHHPHVLVGLRRRTPLRAGIHPSRRHSQNAPSPHPCCSAATLTLPRI